VVGDATNGSEAVRLAHGLRPDVVLVDLVMPELDGIAATEDIRRELPDTKVVIGCGTRSLDGEKARCDHTRCAETYCPGW
jgi:NarL family two-component system response regulator LiaR